MSEATATVVVPMPHMGVSVEEGTVIEWLVDVGDTVSAEQPICAIATDKGGFVELALHGGYQRVQLSTSETLGVGERSFVVELGARHDANVVGRSNHLAHVSRVADANLAILYGVTS